VFIGGYRCAVRSGDVERVAHVIAVAVREHDVRDILDSRRLVRREGRIAGEERIDQHRPAGEVEAEGGMAIPGDLHRVRPVLRLRST
jgi:hypothetical protein